MLQKYQLEGAKYIGDNSALPSFTIAKVAHATIVIYLECMVQRDQIKKTLGSKLETKAFDIYVIQTILSREDEVYVYTHTKC